MCIVHYRIDATRVADLSTYCANSASIKLTFLMCLKFSPPLKCYTDMHAELCTQRAVQEAWVIRAITTKTDLDCLCRFRHSQQSLSKQRVGRP